MAIKTTPLTEESRIYQYPRQRLIVPKPRSLRVSESGNHYILIESGELIIAAPGWNYIEIDDKGKGWTV